MVISSIRLLGSSFNSIELGGNVNIIIGRTGSKKTLLYKLILFTLNYPSNVDFNNTKSVFPEISGVEIEFEKSGSRTMIRRDFGDSFHAYIGGEEYKSPNKYGDAINALFDFTPIKSANGNRSFGFGFKEFLNFIFIPEEQLSASKSIFFREGFPEKEKNKNNFRYIVSGKTIGDDVVRSQTTLSRYKKSVIGFTTALNNTIKKPSDKEIRERKEIALNLESVSKETGLLLSEIENSGTQKRLIQISIERIKTLLKTYWSSYEEINAGLLFEASKVGADEISEVDLLFLSSIKSEIADLNSSLDYLNENLRENEEKTDSLLRKKLGLEEKRAQLQQQLDQLAFIGEYELLHSATSSVLSSIKERSERLQNETKDIRKEIDNLYSKNLTTVCLRVMRRLETWGFGYVDVHFDENALDFCFNNERLSIVPKGKKSIFSFAVSIELLLLAQKHGITSLNTIIADSLWVATDIEGFSKEEMANRIIADLNQEHLQVIILENEIEINENKGVNLIRI